MPPTVFLPETLSSNFLLSSLLDSDHLWNFVMLVFWFVSPIAQLGTSSLLKLNFNREPVQNFKSLDLAMVAREKPNSNRVDEEEVAEEEK